MPRLLVLLTAAILLATGAPAALAQDPVPTTTAPPPATTEPAPTTTEPDDDLTITVPPEDLDTGEGIEVPAEEDDEDAAGQAPSTAAPPLSPTPGSASAVQGTDELADTGASPLVPIGLGVLLALAGVALLRRRRTG